MKNCKRCNKEFEPQKGLVNYCSIECRNSRGPRSEEFKKIVSEKLTGRKQDKKRPKEVIDKIVEARKLNHQQKILSSEYNELSFESLRWRILYEQKHACNKCGINEWLGKPIILELEHKDGNHFNNDRENLEMLCPNCHSMTDTWRGRNKRKRSKVSDTELLESLMINNWNMRQALIDVNLSPKGGNYKRCHKLKKEYISIV